MKKQLTLVFITLYFLLPLPVWASAGDGGNHAFGVTFLHLTILLLAAKLGGIIEKFKLPAVLGELAAGIALSGLAWAGVSMISDIRTDTVMIFLAQLGAVLLLFEIGLESNLRSILSAGTNAVLVAGIGVIAPFLLGYILLGPMFFPNEDSTAHLFIGAALVATSVGVTVSILKSLQLEKSRAYQTILGAAIIDDVLGLLILAIVSSIASGHVVTSEHVLWLTFKSFGFLALAVLAGQLLAKPISRVMARIHTGTGMKLSLAIIFAFLYAYLAYLVGLEPIIGAFAAGLVLDSVHFTWFDIPPVAKALHGLNGKGKKFRQEIHEIAKRIEHTHVEDMTHSLSIIFVPIFFTFTGLQIDFSSLLDPKLYLVASVMTLVAVASKLLAGLGSRGSWSEKLLVGSAMVPRGEVGLIFAAVGLSIGAISNQVFSTIVLVALLTTFVAAPMIKAAAHNLQKKEALERTSTT